MNLRDGERITGVAKLVKVEGEKLPEDEKAQEPQAETVPQDEVPAVENTEENASAESTDSPEA